MQVETWSTSRPLRAVEMFFCREHYRPVRPGVLHRPSTGTVVTLARVEDRTYIRRYTYREAADAQA